jgi:predicted RNA-binding Zn ribbon-like protein
MRRPPRYDLPNAAPGPLRLVQELVNTSDHEHGREWLETPAALEAWLAERGLEAERLGPKALQRAHSVRDALRELLIANNEQHLIPPGAVEELGRAAGRARLTLSFDRLGAVELVPGAGSAEGAIGRILSIVHAAMADGTWHRLKACRNCHWAFYDHSRNRSASWCSMAICGNRLKTRAYRRRAQARSKAP